MHTAHGSGEFGVVVDFRYETSSSLKIAGTLPLRWRGCSSRKALSDSSEHPAIATLVVARRSDGTTGELQPQSSPGRFKHKLWLVGHRTHDGRAANRRPQFIAHDVADKACEPSLPCLSGGSKTPTNLQTRAARLLSSPLPSPHKDSRAPSSEGPVPRPRQGILDESPRRAPAASAPAATRIPPPRATASVLRHCCNTRLQLRLPQGSWSPRPPQQQKSLNATHDTRLTTQRLPPEPQPWRSSRPKPSSPPSASSTSPWASSS